MDNDDEGCSLSQVEPRPDGGFVVGGAYNVVDPDLESVVFIAALDATGEVEWSQAILRDGSASELRSLETIEDSGYIASALALSFTGARRWELLAVTPEGEQVWRKNLIPINGSGVSSGDLVRPRRRLPGLARRLPQHPREWWRRLPHDGDDPRLTRAS